jgi:hypothetical protein
MQPAWTVPHVDVAERQVYLHARRKQCRHQAAWRRVYRARSHKRRTTRHVERARREAAYRRGQPKHKALCGHAARRVARTLLGAVSPWPASACVAFFPYGMIMKQIGFIPASSKDRDASPAPHQPQSLVVSSQRVRPPQFRTSSIMWRVPPRPSPPSPFHRQTKSTLSAPKRSAESSIQRLLRS